ncbi:hypothetical protein [Capnocytophaga canimorsus]|uniref:hypothetical protein n=1 Tax=Capnocytophaga canimorsus TaxID=28188 RepID=UPI001EDFEE28|nr:hypothetical protein [Capnocytophaga canimorsus]GJQ04467.1 hypothetical protein CAPN009_08820 [Capnocytophaga canimorsus]
MAKRIKPIKCPQCGSTQATETKTDYYRCNSCQSEFFIDSDDININHRHTYDYGTTQLPTASRKYLIISIVSSFAFLIGVFVFFSLIHKNTLPTTAPSVKAKSYWNIDEKIPIAHPQGEPIVLMIGEIITGDYPNKIIKPTFGFYNAKTFEEKALISIDIGQEVNETSLKKMDEGKTYIVINKNRLFLLDENTMNISEITPKQTQLSEFEKGFAKVEASSVYENSLKITNNLGQEYYYFPKLHKAVPYRNHQELTQMIAENPIVEGGRVLFSFSTKWGAYEEKLTDKFPELYKVKIATAAGYPYRELFLRWEYDFFSKKVVFKSHPESRVIWHQNFTPERIYFRPRVLHYDENEVLIFYKNELAESSPYFFQILDAQTGEVKQTFQSAEKRTYLTQEHVTKIKEGYLIMMYNAFIINTQEGKMQEYEITKKLTQW